jgi:hypothetical protein
MPIGKGRHFSLRDIYIDYPFEEVMYRWDHVARKIFVRFYGKSESTGTVPDNNRLYNDALLYGDEITAEEYKDGKKRS